VKSTWSVDASMHPIPALRSSARPPIVLPLRAHPRKTLVRACVRWRRRRAWLGRRRSHACSEHCHSAMAAACLEGSTTTSTHLQPALACSIWLGWVSDAMIWRRQAHGQRVWLASATRVHAIGNAAAEMAAGRLARPPGTAWPGRCCQPGG
jgi:hypothetical protein